MDALKYIVNTVNTTNRTNPNKMNEITLLYAMSRPTGIVTREVLAIEKL